MAFVRAVLANWALGAPDAHAKNYSVFLSADDTALAPLYDVATGFGQEAPWPAMAMSIGGASSIHDVTRRHLLKFAAQLGVSQEHVLAAAELFTEGVPAAFAMASREVAQEEIDHTHLEAIRAALTEHCARLRTALLR